MIAKETTIDFELYTSTQETWTAMLQDCAYAQHSIYFEQYILADDEWGNKFLNLFLDKIKEGVHIHLKLDFIGSLGTRKSNLVESIRQQGGIIEFYRPLVVWDIVKPKNWFPRTHIKCLIIDAQISIMGSSCVRADMKSWRDTNIRLVGAPVRDMMKIFNLGPHFRGDIPETDSVNDQYDLIINDPLNQNYTILDQMLAHIDAAEETILIATPYFIAPPVLTERLFNAKQRGVDITIMASQKTDITLADMAARSNYLKFMRAGINIMLYKPSVLHAKYMIVDDTWATVGSTNIDYVSLYRNREYNLSVNDVEVVSALQGHFKTDSAKCLILDESYYNKVSFIDKIIFKVMTYLKRFL